LTETYIAGAIAMPAKGAQFDTFKLPIAFKPLPILHSIDYADANLDSCART
jgi:hypothetical protein